MFCFINKQLNSVHKKHAKDLDLFSKKIYVGFKERGGGVEEEMIAIPEVTTRLGNEQDECLGSANGEDSKTSE